jgi:hypothetical protein
MISESIEQFLPVFDTLQTAVPVPRYSYVWFLPASDVSPRRSTVLPKKRIQEILPST